MEQKGWLSGLVIDECEDMPSTGAYRSRFGSLLRAYQLIGYSPGRDYDYVEINRLLRSMHQRVLNDAVEGIEGAGGHVSIDGATDLLTLNGEFTTSVVIARCFSMPTGARRWKVRMDASLRPDITLAIRMDHDNREALDYYLLPQNRHLANPVSISPKRTGSWSTRTAATRFRRFMRWPPGLT